MWDVCYKRSDLNSCPSGAGISFSTLAKSSNLLNTSSVGELITAPPPGNAFYFKTLSVPETHHV